MESLPEKQLIPGIKRVIGVMSGEGGCECGSSPCCEGCGDAPAGT